MGISEAIARVKDGVRNGGLSGAFAELSAELRSDAIPAALRPAATRLADLLRVPHAQESAPVPLEAFSAAHPQGGQSGVCPFTGMTGSMGELFAGLDPAAQAQGDFVGVAAPAIVENAEREVLATAVAVPVQVELPLEDPSAAAPVSAERVEKAEAELVRAEKPRKKPSARVHVELKKTTGEERAKKAPTSDKPAARKVAGSEKKAASTPANETSARPSAKPPAKRPSAKAGRKKD